MYIYYRYNFNNGKNFSQLFFCTQIFSPIRSQEIYGAVLLALESGSKQIRCEVSVPHNTI